MTKFFVAMTLAFSAVAVQQSVVKEMTNQELTDKIVDHESRIKHLETAMNVYGNHIVDLETAMVALNSAPNPQVTNTQPVSTPDVPLWGLLQAGMTEEEVQLLIGNPISVGGGNSWSQWSYQAAGKLWKQWSYPRGGYVIFSKPEQNKQFGIQIPHIEEYKVEEWFSPKK